MSEQASSGYWPPISKAYSWLSRKLFPPIVPGIPTNFSVRVEYAFVVLPVITSGMVLLYQGDVINFLLGPEWCFIAAVLAGQVVIRYTLLVSSGAGASRIAGLFLPRESIADHLGYTDDDLVGHFGTVEAGREELEHFRERISRREIGELFALQATYHIVALLIPALVIVILTIMTAVERGQSTRTWLIGAIGWLLFFISTFRYFRVHGDYESAIYTDHTEERKHELRSRNDDLMKLDESLNTTLHLTNELAAAKKEIVELRSQLQNSVQRAVGDDLMQSSSTG